jgi:7-keto-8-aminopelargonate synthetase-like enzyme
MAKLPVSAATATTITLNGREVLCFGGCNYLGLAHHPEVIAAVARGLMQFGLSTSASRETTGNTVLHDRLEAELRKFLEMEDAVVVPDGYTANLAIAQALGRDHQVALIDRLSHHSIKQAIRCGGMRLVEFDHLDTRHASRLIEHELASNTQGIAVFTDGIFAAEGSMASVAALLNILPARNATLVVDDCHGFCVLGPRGQGTLSLQRTRDKRIVLTTTLAKGLGCHGGVIAGPGAICSAVRAGSSAYIGTTPTSPGVINGALEALAIVQRDPARIRRLQENAAHMGEMLRARGLDPVSTPAPIFSFTHGSEVAMQRLHADLLQAGILAPLITYPGGPAPVYFRLSVNSEHTPAQIELLGEALEARLRQPVAA